MKDLYRKWKVKLTFRGAYRLSGIGIFECLEIIDLACNLKRLDGLTRLTLTPMTPCLVAVCQPQLLLTYLLTHILRQIYAAVPAHTQKRSETHQLLALRQL